MQRQVQRIKEDQIFLKCYLQCQQILRELRPVINNVTQSSNIIYRENNKGSYDRRFITDGVKALRQIFHQRFQNLWYSKESIMSSGELTFRDKKESFFLTQFLFLHIPDLINENRLSDFYQKMMKLCKQKQNEFLQQFFSKIMCLMISYFHIETKQQDKFIILLAITNDNGIQNKGKYLGKLVTKLKYHQYLNIEKLEAYIKQIINSSKKNTKYVNQSSPEKYASYQQINDNSKKNIQHFSQSQSEKYVFQQQDEKMNIGVDEPKRQQKSNTENYKLPIDQLDINQFDQYFISFKSHSQSESSQKQKQ